MGSTSTMVNENTPLQGGGDKAPTSSINRFKVFFADFYETNHFLLKAILAIIVAKAYPPLGAQLLYPEITAQWMAVMFIFCMAGILIKTSELSKAVTRCGFNSFVLLFNFIGVSAIVYSATRLLIKWNLLNDGMADGMIVCSCMPMSVSMVIVFTRTAMGETANATLVAPASSLISVFLSPLLILFYIGTKTKIDLPSVIVKLLLRVLLPMIIGQLLRLFVKPVVTFVEDNITTFKRSQEYALIYIVYSVFCKTFQQTIEGAEFMDIVSMAVFQFTLLVICTIIAWICLKILFRDSPRLRVMGIFGCVQKSAAVGIPLIGAIYEHDPKLAGLYTLPLLIWHPSQMILGSALVPHLAEGVKKLEEYLGDPNAKRRQSFFGSTTKVIKRTTLHIYHDALVAESYDMLLEKLDKANAEENEIDEVVM